MKKIVVLLAFWVSVSCAIAQDVTKFLGIPVDGYKSEMIKKLKAKGYIYHSDNDYLTGEFNGRDVNIFIVTNNNKVYRIMVADANYVSETDIKIRFNTLVRQFEKNKRYVNSTLGSVDFILSESEDISYEMSVNNKRYQASYWQITQELDSAATRREFLEYVNTNYGSMEALINMSEDEIESMKIAIIAHMYEKFENNSVWFTIAEGYGRYGIILFYDNQKNQANGEDL